MLNHGNGGYASGCRCDTCRVAHAAYQREYSRRNGARARKQERDKRYARPTAPVVYVWMNPDGRADYVGRGTTQRAKSHRAKPWWTADHTLLSMTCDTEWQAMEMEGVWGRVHQPRHNIEGYRHAAQPAQR